MSTGQFPNPQPKNDEPGTWHAARPGDANVFSVARLGLDATQAREAAANLDALSDAITAVYILLEPHEALGIDGIDPNGAPFREAQPITPEQITAALEALDVIRLPLIHLATAADKRASQLFSVLVNVWEGHGPRDAYSTAIPKSIPAVPDPTERAAE